MKGGKKVRENECKEEKSVRLCELTPLPLAAHCVARTKAAAASDCTHSNKEQQLFDPPPIVKS